MRPLPLTSAQRLEQLRKRMSATCSGRTLLALEQQHHLPVFLLPGLEEDAALNEDHTGKSLWLNADRSDDELVGAYGHELRHLWQDSVLANSCYFLRVLPQQSLMSMRIEEGDAFLHQLIFTRELYNAGDEAPYRAFLTSLEGMSKCLGSKSHQRVEALEQAGDAPNARLPILADAFDHFHKIMGRYAYDALCVAEVEDFADMAVEIKVSREEWEGPNRVSLGDIFYGAARLGFCGYKAIACDGFDKERNYLGTTTADDFYSGLLTSLTQKCREGFRHATHRYLSAMTQNVLAPPETKVRKNRLNTTNCTN